MPPSTKGKKVQPIPRGYQLPPVQQASFPQPADLGGMTISAGMQALQAPVAPIRMGDGEAPAYPSATPTVAPIVAPQLDLSQYSLFGALPKRPMEIIREEVDPRNYVNQTDQAQVSTGLNTMMATDGDAQYQQATVQMLQRAMLENPSRVAGILAGSALSPHIGGANPYGAGEQVRDEFLNTAGRVGDGQTAYALKNTERTRQNLAGTAFNLGLPSNATTSLAYAPASLDLYGKNMGNQMQGAVQNLNWQQQANTANAELLARQQQAQLELEQRQAQVKAQAEQEAYKLRQAQDNNDRNYYLEEAKLQQQGNGNALSEEVKKQKASMDMQDWLNKPQNFIGPDGLKNFLQIRVPDINEVNAGNAPQYVEATKELDNRLKYELSQGSITDEQYKFAKERMDKAIRSNPYFANPTNYSKYYDSPSKGAFNSFLKWLPNVAPNSGGAFGG